MEEFLISHGLPALFILSFLAATVLPLGSEWLLVALTLQGVAPGPAVTIATIGNTLGACTTYLIGLWGADWIIRKVLRVGETQQRKAEEIYTRYGSWSLLLSWVPVIGDPLCLAGGLLHVRFQKFLLLVFIGKLARYILVAAITVHGMAG